MTLLKAWTLAGDDGFVARRRLVIDAKYARLKLAKRAIGLDRVHAAQQCAAHVALGGNDFFGTRDDFLHNRLRNDDHAVAIAKEVIAGRDGDGADRNRLSERVGDPAL